MSFLNFTLSRIAYMDDTASTDPLNKAFDVHTAKIGLYAQFPTVCTKVVEPGQIVLLESTSRALTYDSTTQFSFSHPELGSDIVRMRWTGTGTAPSFRTLRAIAGGVNTQVEFSRASNTAAKLTNTSGTAWNTSSVQIGDEVFFQKSVEGEFTSPFSEVIQGQRFVIVDKGVNYIVLRDNGVISAESDIALGADYSTAMRVFSSLGVKTGDKIKFSSSAGLRPDNKSYVLEVSQVSDRDLYFINPYGIDETAVPGEQTFVVFERMLNFLSIDATGAVDIRIDSSSASNIPLYEFETGRSIFMATVSATSVYAVNNGSHPVNVTVHTCSF
jgi:hypothetical protein